MHTWGINLIGMFPLVNYRGEGGVEISSALISRWSLAVMLKITACLGNLVKCASASSFTAFSQSIPERSMTHRSRKGPRLDFGSQSKFQRIMIV